MTTTTINKKLDHIELQLTEVKRSAKTTQQLILKITTTLDRLTGIEKWDSLNHHQLQFKMPCAS